MGRNDQQKLSVINTAKWLQENEDKFKPPVCNKLMHNEQLTVMFVGGPNIREDYHIEEGEELFYQIKGDISVKILENNKHKEIFIKEGELFLLPARIPHSPQRPANTIGLVIERKRPDSEVDGVRWFVPNSTTSLYEKWFHCLDLGTQLAPVIKGYFASEEYATKVPGSNVLPEYPFELNSIKIESDKHGPYKLKEKIQTMNNNVLDLTPKEYQLQFLVQVFGVGEHTIENFNETGYDLWLWQLEGQSEVKLSDENINLFEKDSVLVPAGHSKNVNISVATGLLFKVAQDSRLK